MERGQRGNSEIHVLVLPVSIQGHINPMLQLSKRLASKGLRVTLITSTSIGKSVQAQASSVNVESMFDGFNEGEKAASIDEYFERFKATVPQSLVELINKHSSTQYPIKYFIYDSALPWTLDVVQNLGIEAGPFFTQSCAVTALYYHALQGALKVPLEESVVSLPSLPQLEFGDLPPFVHGAGAYPAIYDIVFSQFKNIDKASWILWNTFHELEDEVGSNSSANYCIRFLADMI